MGSVGLVIVSHSKHIAEGVVELISEVKLKMFRLLM